MKSKPVYLVVAGIFIASIVIAGAREARLKRSYRTELVSPTPIVSQKFDLSNTDTSKWHTYANSKYNITLQLPPGLDAYVNNADASGSIPATGTESYAWLEWRMSAEPHPLAELMFEGETKRADQSLHNFIVSRYRIKGDTIPASHIAYDTFSDVEWRVLELSQIVIDGHEAWYLSFEPTNSEQNRSGAREFLFIALDPKTIIELSADTEYNYDPHVPVLMAIGKTLKFD